MKRNFTNLLVASLMLGTSLSASAQVFDKEQYQKALWMTGRFYGAQRSGAGPSWLIAEHEPTQLSSGISSSSAGFVKGQDFVKDADGDYDLTGGWFDCGDHARFGQTEFYSAYMLILGYSEFPAGYDDYYSADYKGYIGASDYTWEGKKGVPNGIPDILDEVKYATDFFLKCVRDKSTFYYQVGDGDTDHKVWCTSSVKAALLNNSDGGEKDGSRPVSKATGNATSMAALCGSTLAAMSRAYSKFDAEYANKCLEKAKTAYEFVMNTSKGNSGAGGYYGAKGKYEPDIVILCMELYRATGDEAYLTAAENNCAFMEGASTWNHNFSLCYNNTEDLAYYLLAMYGNNELAKTRLKYYVNDLYKPSTGYILNVKNDAWGVLRFPANQAFVLALYDKLNGDDKELNPYSLASIEYIMGSNSKKFSYIVGFGENFPHYPHHRNFYGLDNNDEGSLTTQEKFMQLGYMVGGSLNDGAYEDSEKSYTYSEGGIDYNAGLVSSLGYINSLLNTVNVNKFGHPAPDLGDDVSICGSTSVELNTNVPADGKKVFTWTLDGVQIESSTSANTYKATKAGAYTCTIDSAGEWQTNGSINVLGTLPELNLPASVTLCDPATYTFDATIACNGVTYQWTKDNTEITGATNATLTVYSAGTYAVTATASGCPSKTASVTVDSKLPVLEQTAAYSDGKVTLTATGDGQYEWYDAAEGGNLIGTGSTLNTKISENTMFYVQDASSVSMVAGPTEATFQGQTAVNWGKIGAKFTAKRDLMIKGVTIYLQSVYSAGSVNATLTLNSNGTDTDYTTDAVDVTSAGYYTFNLSNPIELTAGDYTLTANGNFGVGFFSKGADYSTYQNNGDVIEFTGATNGTASDFPFPGLTDWQIQAGSGCGRAAILANYNPNGPSSGIKCANSDNFNVYPNPVKDELNIVSAEATEGTVEFINALGNVVKTVRLNGQNTNINVSDLNAGFYAVKIKSNNGVAVKQIIKK